MSMTVKAVVDKIDEQHYRAAISEPIALESIGTSAAEAISKLRDSAIARLKTSQVVEIELSGIAENNRLSKFAGIWKGNAELDEYRRSIEEHRKEMDALEFP